MALSTHAGGAADKAGFIHEVMWGIHAFLAILNGAATAIRIEVPGEDGAEFFLERPSGLEYWQAKRQVTGQETWTLQKLNEVLKYFFEKTATGEKCVFASVSDAPDLRMLTENAVAAESFEQFRAKFLDKKRTALFVDLRKLLKPNSDEELYDFLRTVSVQGGREITLEPVLGYALGATFTGPWQNTYAVLCDLYLRSSHERLTATDIERYLRERGVERRRAGVPDGPERIRNVTRAYVAGQHAKLIGGRPIRRALADQVVEKIKGNAAGLDILITSAAGGGKSACLTQVTEGLHAADIPVLAFRLDRLEPAASSIALGEQLGLGESPTLVLVDSFPGQDVVLLIDQLDFVSTTSGRHPDFFDTVAALREEVLGLRDRVRLHLILACRKFDYDHDHRLKQLSTKDKPPMELREFDLDEVRNVVRQEGGDFAQLTPHQQRMLRLPQNLSLFVEAGLARSENRFTTPKELCDAYWNEKRKRVAADRSDFAQLWRPAIERMAATMSAQQELSVPFRVLDDFPPEFLEKMASEGVLTWDGKRYGFGHETFFDYCFARTLPSGGRDFVQFLETDMQHLFRRAQLRQVLAFLRDDDFNDYLQNVNRLFCSKRIRCHLKVLTVELLAAHPAPCDDELGLLLPWMEAELSARRAKQANSDKLGLRIWDVFFASRTLFPVADRTGLVEKWLRSDEPWLLDIVVLYLRWQLEQHGDRVAELLEPFAGQAKWRDRLRYMMEGRNLDKSRRFFDFFLRLLKLGILDDARDRFASNGTFWSMLHGLTEERPQWCAELAGAWLDRQTELTRSTDAQGENIREALDDSFGITDLFTSAEMKPKDFLQYVLPAVLRAAMASTAAPHEKFPRDSIWPIRIAGEALGLREAYLGSCELALSALGKDCVADLLPFVEQLKIEPLHTANSLLLTAYASSPEQFADEALALLAAEPDRLHSGYSDSPYWSTRQVIVKCSPHCSEEILRKFESTVLAFVPQFERSKDGLRYRGHAAFNFLSAVPEARLSTAARRQLAEWKEKFKEPDPPPVGVRSYFVGSPIEEKAATHMSNDQWLGAIAKYNTEQRLSPAHPEKGSALELARLLQKFTEEEPERFARLSLEFTEQTHPYYFSHVLRALTGATIAFDLKIEVARRVFEMDNHDTVKSCLKLLGSVGAAELPEDAVQFIQRAAKHGNPESELWDEGYYGGDILMHGINTVRGHVAEAVRDLIWSDKRYLATFRTTVDILIRDPSVAVRATVASTLMAVMVHDAPLARHLAIQLLESDARLLGTRYVEEFIHRAIREAFEPFSEVIRSMLKSEREKICRVGGKLACLARLYHVEADDMAEAALDGNESCRMGACEVAKSNLLHGECRAWCEMALARLFKDKSAIVRREAAGCFWYLWQSPETPLTGFDDLIRAFLASPAFAEEPSFLLHALEETKQKVPEATLDVCEEFVVRCATEAKDFRTSISGDAITIAKLTFTAYAQLQAQSLQIRALEVIDSMSLEGLGSANAHLSEFER